MKKKYLKRVNILLLMFSVLSPGLLHAEGGIPQAVTSRLHSMIPGSSADEVTATPVPGLYEARFGTTILYLSADGRYLIDGQLLDLKSRKNLTDGRIAAARVEILERLDESEMVVYSPEQTRKTLTIFTDIDCPYCVRLHEEREALLDAGIKLRYLLYPRAGFNSPSYHKAVTVWCSEDRAEAMTLAKAGVALEQERCENPVLEQIRLASSFGLKGTPHIVVDSGEVISGYMPATDLIRKLGLE